MAISNLFGDSFSNMNAKTRYGIIIGAVLILFVFVVSLYLVFHKEYEVLFSDLNSRDAAVILSELEKAKVEYKLEENGSRILVEKGKVYETRLKIVNSVPSLSGGVGFEIFDKDDFGTTEFAQKINYQRALQGELARTIMALDEVKFARVHLVLPSSSIFKRKGSDSQASVTLVLRNNKTLSKEQVSGIQKLVASSTPSLKVENVTILDQKGVMLAASESDEHHFADASKKLLRKQEIEKYLTEKAQTILNQTFNSTSAFVSIDVSLDFNNIKKTREQVISPEEKDENVAHKKEMQMKGNKRDLADTTRSTLEVQYQLGKEIEEIISTPGSIQRLSIAIVVPTGLSNEQIEYVKSIVGSAVGYDSDRGDLIAVTSTLSESETTARTQPGSEDEVVGAKSTDVRIDVSGYDNKYLQWVSATMNNLLQIVSRYPIVSFALATLMFMLFVYLLFRVVFARREPQAPRQRYDSISDEEKKKLLSDLKDWLAAEKV